MSIQNAQGYNIGRDIPDKYSNVTIPSGGLSNGIRDFKISCDDTFYFSKWCSLESNKLKIPYYTATEDKYTLIDNPTFLAEGYWNLGNMPFYPFIWCYVYSTDTNTNDNKIYYKHNVTNCSSGGKPYGMSKVGANSYQYFQNNIHNLAQAGDYFYISFTNDNTDINCAKNLVCKLSTWYGSFFKVVSTGSHILNLIEDASICTTLYPGTVPNNFIKSPSALPNFDYGYALLYDLGWSFRRTSISAAPYYRVLSITINQKLYTNSFEYDGTIFTSDNFTGNFNDGFTKGPVAANQTMVVSNLAPVCRSLTNNIRFSITADTYTIYRYSVLGQLVSVNAGVFPYQFYKPDTYTSGKDIQLNLDIKTFGLPVSFHNVRDKDINYFYSHIIESNYLGRI